MNRTDSKWKDNGGISSSIEKAEEAVQNSITRFEIAMEHLAEKVEGTSQKLHHVRDVAQDSKEKLMHFKDEVQATIDPLRPYMKQIQSYSTKAIGTVRAAPRPYLWLAMGVIGFAAFKYFKGRDIAWSPRKPGGLSEFSGEYSSEFPYQ